MPDILNESLPELEAIDFAVLGPNRIAFERSSLNGVTGIYLVDGAAQRRESYLGGTLTQGVAVSPNGTEVAFTTLTPFNSSLSEQTFWDVYVVRLDGSALRRIAGLPGNSEGPPSWNPIGDRILFTGFLCCDPPVQLELYEQSPVKGPGDRRLLATLNSGDSTWAWDRQYIAASPSGRLALTNRDGDASRGVHVLDPGAAVPSRVYEPPPGFRVRAPAWSPDGTRLVFLETTEGDVGSTVSETRVKVVRMDESSVADIGVLVVEGANHEEFSGANTFSACWTSDGTRIVFSAVDGDLNAHIYVLPVSGGDPTPLTYAAGATDRSVSCLT